MRGFEVLAGSQAAPIGLVPHSLTILIEFQAYVLLMLGAYLLGSGLAPSSARRRPEPPPGIPPGPAADRLAQRARVRLVVGALYEAFSLVPGAALIRTWG
jgi:hypothetical protein